MRRIKTISFDLDDTLWDLKPTLLKAEQLSFDWLIANAPAMAQRFDLSTFMQWRGDIYQQRSELHHQISELRRVAVTEALVEAGYSTTEAQSLSLQAFELFLEARHQVDLFEEAEPLLKDLKPHYQLGALTNGNADIRKLAISQYFDYSFSAEQLNASKPAPDLFHAALKTCQAQPQQLIHIGDHLNHDVQGALDAGCHAIWVNLKGQTLPDHQQAAIEVTCLSDIVEAVQMIEEQNAKR